MPGVDGIEATRFIKQFQNAPLVIMVTSDHSSDCRARAKAAGADGFVDKGGDLRNQLHNLFHDLFRSPREPPKPG
jgi:CheY-like chemotaxis protein